jgi:hypothetical protein
MVRFQKKCSKEFLEMPEREAWFMSLFLAVAIKFTEEHLVECPKEALDSAAALGLAWGRKYKPNLEIDGHLFNVLRGEVRPIIGIQNFGNATHMPMRVPFPPDSLSKGEGDSRW